MKSSRDTHDQFWTCWRKIIPDAGLMYFEEDLFIKDITDETLQQIISYFVT